jgi:hypothetical protein
MNYGQLDLRLPRDKTRWPRALDMVALGVDHHDKMTMCHPSPRTKSTISCLGQNGL